MQFRDSYLKATNFIDLEEDWMEALKKLDPELVESELKNMNDALTIMGNEMATEYEKKLYQELKNDYEDLKYLFSVYDDLDNLSTDEKIDVGTKLSYIFINRDAANKEDNK